MKEIKYSSEKASKTDKERVLRFVGSNEAIDRDGDVIRAAGWKLKDYKKNSVVLFGHNYSGKAVAKTKKVWVDGKKLMFDIEFPEASISAEGDTLFKLYKNGYMSAVSVGFQTDHKTVEYPKNRKGVNRILNDCNLLEISLVSVPANPMALLTSKSIDEAKRLEVVDDLELDQETDEKTDTTDDIDDTENTDDYSDIVKDLKQEMDDSKKDNYFYKLFEEYKDTTEKEDDIYQELIDELQ